MLFVVSSFFYPAARSLQYFCPLRSMLIGHHQRRRSLTSGNVDAAERYLHFLQKETLVLGHAMAVVQ